MKFKAEKFHIHTLIGILFLRSWKWFIYWGFCAYNRVNYSCKFLDSWKKHKNAFRISSWLCLLFHFQWVYNNSISSDWNFFASWHIVNTSEVWSALLSANISRYIPLVPVDSKNTFYLFKGFEGLHEGCESGWRRHWCNYGHLSNIKSVMIADLLLIMIRYNPLKIGHLDAQSYLEKTKVNLNIEHG